MKLELQDSLCFHVVGPRNAGCKVVPGMSANFTIIFTPLENKVQDTEGCVAAWWINHKQNKRCLEADRRCNKLILKVRTDEYNSTPLIKMNDSLSGLMRS